MFVCARAFIRVKVPRINAISSRTFAICDFSVGRSTGVNRTAENTEKVILTTKCGSYVTNRRFARPPLERDNKTNEQHNYPEQSVSTVV